jgi:hypothetical protein
MLWGMRRFSAHFPAAISSHGIEPDRESLWVLNPGQMFQRTEENLLCRILCVFWVSTDFHAEGIDRVLEQADCFFDSFRRIEAQEIGCLVSSGRMDSVSQEQDQYILLTCETSAQIAVRLCSCKEFGCPGKRAISLNTLPFNFVHFLRGFDHGEADWTDLHQPLA